jgi:hypothetical protein
MLLPDIDFGPCRCGPVGGLHVQAKFDVVGQPAYAPKLNGSPAATLDLATFVPLSFLGRCIQADSCLGLATLS